MLHHINKVNIGHEYENTETELLLTTYTRPHKTSFEVLLFYNFNKIFQDTVHIVHVKKAQK